MDLEREPNPQPAPTPTGAFDKQAKMRIFVMGGAIIFFFLMIVGWMISRPRTVVLQGPMMPKQVNGDGKSGQIDPKKEDAADDKKQPKPFVPPPDDNSGGQLPPARSSAEPVASEKKKTTQDEYEDLLKTASLAGNRVGGESNGSSNLGLPNVNGNPVSDRNGDVLRNAVSGESDRGRNKGPREIGASVLPAGTFIYCSLVNQLNGENTGPVKVQVANDVYYPDTTDLAIPQGSIFLGEAQRVSGANQQRLAVGFSILQYRRDGKLYQVSLDKLPGLDQQGATALKDKVNNHYLQIFGASLAVGAIGGLAQIGNGSYGGYSGIDPSVQIRNGATQQMAQNSAQILNRFLNRLPTITIRPGTPVVVFFPYGIDLQ
jgi:type IV secretory pathway VirB10-like protein